MSTHAPRAVFDRVVFLQGAGRRHGPCRRCLELVDQNRAGLYLSPPVLQEISDVLTRPMLLRKIVNPPAFLAAVEQAQVP